VTGMEPLTSNPLTTWAALSLDEMSLVLLVAALSLVLMSVAREVADLFLWLLGVRP